MKAGTCRHFTGLMNAECKEGVNYHAVRDESARPYRFPCLGGADSAGCARFSAYTEAEAEADQKRFAETIARAGLIREAIVKATGGKRKVGGQIECPACKAGKVQYTVAYNGHVHAACSTPDCARWME